MGRTLFEKVWDSHKIADLGDNTCLIYIDRVFFHERTGCIALQGLEAAGRKVFGVPAIVANTATFNVLFRISSSPLRNGWRSRTPE